MIFNMAGGGGGGDILAALVVFVDTGSTVTVTDGVSTFTGTSVNGECIFDRLTPATWTVTATNGVDTVTNTVVITNSALIDGYPDPLISSLELTYKDNTIVAVFWGITNSTSLVIPTREQMRLADSEYFTIPLATSGSYTAQTDFNAVVRIFGAGATYASQAVTSDVTIYKNNVSIGTASFDNTSSTSSYITTSFVAGDTFCLKTKASFSEYVSGGFVVEVV